MKRCGYCGRENPLETAYCSECGTAFEDAARSARGEEACSTKSCDSNPKLTEIKIKRFKTRDSVASLFTCPAIIAGMLNGVGVLSFIIEMQSTSRTTLPLIFKYSLIRYLSRYDEQLFSIGKLGFIFGPIGTVYCFFLLAVLGGLYHNNPTAHMKNNLRVVWLSFVPSLLMALVLWWILYRIDNWTTFG